MKSERATMAPFFKRALTEWQLVENTNCLCTCRNQNMQKTDGAHRVGSTVHTIVRKRLHVAAVCSNANESRSARPAPTFKTGKKRSLPLSTPSSVAATRRRISHMMSSLRSRMRIGFMLVCCGRRPNIGSRGTTLSLHDALQR
jgi:hypothetical protein